jgi:hypothetical protein
MLNKADVKAAVKKVKEERVSKYKTVSLPIKVPKGIIALIMKCLLHVIILILLVDIIFVI